MGKLVALRQPMRCLYQNLLCPNPVLPSVKWENGKQTCLSVRKRDFHLTTTQFKDVGKRTLPTLIYVQNPITWLMNKLDFRMLKSAWDVNFDENEFKRGTKQAISVICCLVSEGLWDQLRGLITRPALLRLRRDVDVNWTDEQRRNICIEPIDIKLALPRRVHFMKISDQRFADVDMVFLAMKFKEKEPSMLRDVVFIEMVARFHRNYTIGQLPNWTVSLFKVTRFNVHRLDKVKSPSWDPQSGVLFTYRIRSPLQLQPVITTVASAGKEDAHPNIKFTHAHTQ